MLGRLPTGEARYKFQALPVCHADHRHHDKTFTDKTFNEKWLPTKRS